MRPLGVADLQAAPELAQLVTLDVAMVVLLTALRVEHPTLDADYGPGDPPSLLAARQVCQRVRALRRSISAYHAAVIDAIGAPEPPDPF